MLKEIFDKNPNIIINNDIDGFLSGMVLQNYCGCKIVGFSNSKNQVWVTPEVESIYDPVYIDMYVNRPEVVCIDQHVVADTQERLNKILGYGTKFNPNLQLAPRTLEKNYGKKYPFGTVHYLISLLGNEGIDVELDNLTKGVFVEAKGQKYRTCPGQLLLRADDALYNTLVAYRENSSEWWERLNTCASIQKIVDYINSCAPEKAVAYENNIGKIFMELGCRQNKLKSKRDNRVFTDSDGSFERITDNNIPGRSGRINGEILQFIAKIGAIMGMKMDVPDTYILHKAEIMDRSAPEGIIDAEDLFSYAFVAGPYKRENCFSYTRGMRD